MTYILAYLAFAYLFWVVLSFGIEQDIEYVCTMFSGVSDDYKKGTEKATYPTEFGGEKDYILNHIQWAKTVMVFYSIIACLSFPYVIIYSTTRLLKTILKFFFASKKEKSNEPTTF